MASLAPKASILGFVEIICNILEGSLGGRFLILIRDVVHIGAIANVLVASSPTKPNML